LHLPFEADPHPIPGGHDSIRPGSTVTPQSRASPETGHRNPPGLAGPAHHVDGYHRPTDDLNRPSRGAGYHRFAAPFARTPHGNLGLEFDGRSSGG